MIFIKRPQTDPFFNIAAEEYILKRDDRDILMLWQCSPSVIIGKHQNTLTEVNVGFANRRNIPVIRRLSGGGTVYHDEGNINYTVIKSEKRKDRLIDFRKFTQPVIDFLGTLGTKARFEGKNNLVINRKKFSGNSAHVFKNRVMHHGTLLFDSNLEMLDQIIRADTKSKIEDKAVQSVRAAVTNISEHLDVDMTIRQFKEKLENYLFNYYSINEIHELDKTDISAINTLMNEKYSKWEWNFGYSPDYIFRNEISGIKMNMKVKNGKIIDAFFEGDFEKKEKLERLLLNISHRKDELSKVVCSEYGQHKLAGLLIKLLSPAD